jgi:hypothetical protein
MGMSKKKNIINLSGKDTDKSYFILVIYIVKYIIIFFMANYTIFFILKVIYPIRIITDKILFSLNYRI